LILRARMTKEEYAQQALEDGKQLSFQIRQYRVLSRDTDALPPETELNYHSPVAIAENI
jgi:hypothetical protein